MREATPSYASFQIKGALCVAKCGSRNKNDNAHHWAEKSAEKTPLSAFYVGDIAMQEDNYN